MSEKRFHDSGGFSLWELLMVITIIGFLALSLSNFDLFTRKVERESSKLPLYTDGIARLEGRLGVDVRLAGKAERAARAAGSGVLRLELINGDRIEYFMSDNTLFRSRRGEPTGAQAVLSGMETFSPAVDPGSGLVSVEFRCGEEFPYRLSFAMRNGVNLQ
jgi:prepilin-type N-terminal cleavage/methylation domain-containing protein